MKTNIVILHAGYPFYHQAAVIPYQFESSTKNIYVDLSCVVNYQPVYMDILRNVIALTPVDRILYASDAFGTAEQLGCAAWWARRVMTDVFEEFIDKYGWTEEDCRRTAEMVLNENGKRLLMI
jgi:predicted TIM-barrel fold metal-dependent hydrolase